MAIATAPTDVSNAELIRWAFEILNRHDATSLGQLYTSETVERFPDRTCHGGDEIVAYFEDVFAAVPDWNIQIVGLAEQGEDVFVQWHMTGTHSGPLLGVAPTGKALAIDGIDHFVVRNVPRPPPASLPSTALAGRRRERAPGHRPRRLSSA